MKFEGVKGSKNYTITVINGKVRSILVEAPETYYRAFYQRKKVDVGLTIDEVIYEEAVLAICKKNLESWMELYDALWNDKKFGQKLQQKIFEKHLN